MKLPFAPAFILVLLAGILPELLSGNTLAPDMLRPDTLLFLIAAYGLPALLIREFAVRHGTGFGGLFLIGMAYGVINEALLAKTVFRSAGVPVDVYDGYGFAGGIQWAWTAFILPWHALASVMLPIAFAHRAVPHAAVKPWLGARTALALAAVLAALISLFYLYEDTSGIAGTAQMLLALWGAIALLALASFLLPQPQAALMSPVRLMPFLIGVSGILPFLSLLAVAHLRWPIAMYLIAAIAWVALYWFLTRRFADINTHAFGWFGLGWYLQIGTFSWLGAAAGHPSVILADVAALAVLWWILRRAADTPAGAAA
jgi:hypothetical protein